jgi:energy-coupling factor transporter ATP-binding protein EcfA2
MSPQILPITISALHEILKWSESRPDWQRDALRRIISQESLSETDIAELDRLCRAKHSADTSKEPSIALQPLAGAHLPPAPGAASSVTLVSVANCQHVNRLPSNQTLAFGTAPGLTIVFGDNGTGKSGYARVVKKACRTRGIPPAISPNAFEPHPKSPATADIVFQTGGSSHTYAWADTGTSDPRLANVFVFDASTAEHYLEEDGPAAFTPHGLDVLPKLSKTCDAINARMQKDIAAVEGDISGVAKNWKYTAATKVGSLIQSLSAKTKPSDVENLASLNPEESQQLHELNEALKSDPKQKARETRASAARLKNFATKVAAMAGNLSSKQCSALEKVIENAATTEAAAKAFATGAFDDTYLLGTGNDLWRSLFDAARAYSVGEAYQEQEFPVTDSGARCVLCQQELDSNDGKRLKAFDTFCKDTSQQQANAATQVLAEATTKTNAWQALAADYVTVEADLATATDDQKVALNAFINQCDSMLVNVKGSLAARKWTAPGTLPASPESIITALAAALEKRAEMEESADNPVARAKLVSERDELAAKEWLIGVKDDVLAQVSRYKRVALLKTCQKDTSTNAITAKSREITEQIVTDAFCKQFQDEAKALGLRTISVKMEDIKGKKAETRFGLRLEGAPDHKVHEIASEGEQRCIALAAFLAELSQASHHSALVFDDPVSSLDHWHHQRIAERLVKEAATRQVIVFTHRTSFLHDLQQAATEVDLDPQILHLEWGGGNPGRCCEGLPWDWKTAKDRFDKLEKRQRELQDGWNPIPNEENIQEMRRAYSWLRATLERIVEKEVFSDVVFRFRVYIKVQMLSGVVGFSATECAEIQRLMQKCHDVTEAHDPSAGKHSAIPDPAAYLKDIEDTKAVVEMIQKRKKAQAAAGVAPATKSATGP